jgi:hypothetical protein
MILFFLAVFGLGILNLALGVMCTASQDAVLATERNRLEKAFQGVMKKSVEMQQGVKKFSRGQGAFLNEEIFSAYKDDIAHACEMTVEEVSTVFHRLAVEGELDQRSFIQGCLANRIPITNVDLLQVTVAIRELRDKMSEAEKELQSLDYVFKETCKRIALVDISETPRSLLPKTMDPHGQLSNQAMQQSKRWTTAAPPKIGGIVPGLDFSKMNPNQRSLDIDYSRISPRTVLTPRNLEGVMPEQATEIVDWDVMSQGMLHKRLDEEKIINEYLWKMVRQLEIQAGEPHMEYVPPRYADELSDESSDIRSPGQSPSPSPRPGSNPLSPR